MKPSDKIMADAREAWAHAPEQGLWSEADGAAKAAYVLAALLQHLDEQHDERVAAGSQRALCHMHGQKVYNAADGVRCVACGKPYVEPRVKFWPHALSDEEIRAEANKTLAGGE